MQKVVTQLNDYITSRANGSAAIAEIDAAVELLSKHGLQELIQRAQSASQATSAGVELDQLRAEQANLLAKCDVDSSEIESEIRTAENACNSEIAELRERAEGRPEAIAASIRDEIKQRLRDHDDQIAQLRARQSATRTIRDPVNLLNVRRTELVDRQQQEIAESQSTIRLATSGVAGLGREDIPRLESELENLKATHAEQLKACDEEIERARRSPEHRYVNITQQINTLSSQQANLKPTFFEMVQSSVRRR